MDDPKLPILKAVLDQFLETDRDITARGVMRASDLFKHPTDITRPVLRRHMLDDYRSRQMQMRELAVKTDKNAKGKLLVRLTDAEGKLDEVERQRELLIVAVRGLIRSVGRAKGLQGWIALFADYELARRDLERMNALPSADVHSIKRDDHHDDP